MEHVEFEPLVSTTGAPAPRHTSRSSGLAVAAAVVATLAITVALLTRADRPDTPAEQPAAARAAQILPDPSTQRVTQPPSTRFQGVYESCMSDVDGSPDARERWVESCRRQADRILHGDRIYAACMRTAGGTADSSERHAAACEEQVSAP
jgi:hypothetical protein